jgi:hypothetical protein
VGLNLSRLFAAQLAVGEEQQIVFGQVAVFLFHCVMVVSVSIHYWLSLTS